MKKYTKEYAKNHEQNPKEYWEYKELFRLFVPEKNAKILDLGCNTGDLIILLKDKGYKNVDGIDINQDAIKIAKKKVLNSNINCIDFMKWNSKHKYDVIYALHIIEHIKNTNKFFENIKNKLTKNGICVLSCPNKLAYLMKLEHFLKGKKHCYDPTHIHNFSIIELKKIAKSNGFTIMRKSTSPFDLITQILLEKYKIRIPCLIFGGHNYLVIKND